MKESKGPGGNPPPVTKIDETRLGVFRLLAELKACPDNDRLYGKINPRSQDIQALAADIHERGISEPIVISLDDYIISGHRRATAARVAGLERVPCRVEPIRYDRDTEAFLSMLRALNLQRVKKNDSLIAEAVYDEAKGAAARERLIHHRQAKARSKGLEDLAVGIEKRKRARSKISPARSQMLAATRRALVVLKEYLPTTDRRIHYEFLNAPPLKHARKPCSAYRNRNADWKVLTKFLGDARIEGLISFDDIADDTRPVEEWNVYQHVGAFVNARMPDLLSGYYRSLQQSQPNHIELIEKNSVAGVVLPVAADYAIPVTFTRGYSSVPPRKKVRDRFARSGNAKLVLLFMSDFDCEGINIPQSFAASLVEDAGDRSRLVRNGAPRARADGPGLAQKLLTPASPATHPASTKLPQ